MTDEVGWSDAVKHQLLITAFQGLACNCPTSGFPCISPICRNIQRLPEYDSVSPVEKMLGVFLIPHSAVVFRQVVDTRIGQPFIIAGSGTLGWDQVCLVIKREGFETQVILIGRFKSCGAGRTCPRPSYRIFW